MQWALRTRMDETGRSLIPKRFRIEFLGRRRQFITLLGGATCVWAARARQQSTVPVIVELGFQVDTTVKAITELAPLLRG